MFVIGKLICKQPLPAIISTQHTGIVLIQIANLMNPGFPKDFTGVEYPEKRKLKYFDHVPQIATNVRPQKMFKRLTDMRGPELIHNKFQYGEFGIQAIRGGALRWAHLEMMRLTINRKMDESRMFAVWRVDQPWKAVTKKGQGHRMGSGKGSIDHYVFPVRAGRLIVEMGGECFYEEVYPVLYQLSRKMPFLARVVSVTMLEEEKVEEERIERENINPFTFEHCVKHNMMGANIKLSPYDHIWHGKHR